MNKEIQGLCLCLAGLGLAYVLLMLILVAFTGAKLVKTIGFVLGFSTLLFSLGLSTQVKTRLKQKFQ